ncbi:MAG: hypothetical protein AAFU85_10725 [Planctomycetota bacterium]
MSLSFRFDFTPVPTSLRVATARVTALLIVFGFVAEGVRAQFEFERPPINYHDADVDDPVARLVKRIDSGESKLIFETDFGYLRSVLRELDIDVSSQTLVFSKTSLQLRRISPRHPRALYFNDDVYVGYCHNGDVLEIAATDAKQAATFYTLSQRESVTPEFKRDKGTCLSCHATSRTQDVPGYLMRSVFTEASGQPRLSNGTFVTDATSDFRDRWGGWYVSGDHGGMRHMGNTICEGSVRTFDREIGANRLDLTDDVQVDDYPSPHSDLVALMVLAHQTQMHNAIAAANFETRSAMHQSFTMNRILDRPEGFLSDSAKRRIAASADRVLHHLLFRDEFKLTSAISGTTSFATDFVQSGRRDSRGRSLRDFDLRTRLFKYPCSYLIHSDAFSALPDVVRMMVLKRLAEVLRGGTLEGYEHLDPRTRRDLLSILRSTLPEFRQLL